MPTRSGQNWKGPSSLVRPKLALRRALAPEVALPPSGFVPSAPLVSYRTEWDNHRRCRPLPKPIFTANFHPSMSCCARADLDRHHCQRRPGRRHRRRPQPYWPACAPRLQPRDWTQPPLTSPSPESPDAVERQVRQSLSYSLRPVINATGVILHTNLGRAPLAASALEHVREASSGYSNLEFDIETGERGKRDVHVDRLFRKLLNEGLRGRGRPRHIQTSPPSSSTTTPPRSCWR